MLEVEQQAGILLPCRAQRDLVEIVIMLAPIFGRPAAVERVDRAVACLEESVPGRDRLRIERGRPDLVVDLPADHRRFMAESLAHLARDPPRKLAVARAGEGEMAPRPMLGPFSLLVDPQ